MLASTCRGGTPTLASLTVKITSPGRLLGEGLLRQRQPLACARSAPSLQERWLSNDAKVAVTGEEDVDDPSSTSSSSFVRGGRSWGGGGSHRPPPVLPHPTSPQRPVTDVPPNIVRPPYAATGIVPPVPFFLQTDVTIHDASSIERLRRAARLARRVLDRTCRAARVGVTTDEIDSLVFGWITTEEEGGAYPSPLNYRGFPKSVCSSVNEVVCHGIPDSRPLELGDVASFDVSCFVGGVHGDNCATVVVGDDDDDDDTPAMSAEVEGRLEGARRLVRATREALDAGVAECRPGGCLSSIGGAIQDVADAYGFESVREYRGHGIGEVFHCPPFVRHFRNSDGLELRPGMVFTIEPMLTEGSCAVGEWDDGWTVSTLDGGRAAQFEHTVLITEEGVEVLTVSDPDDLEGGVGDDE